MQYHSLMLFIIHAWGRKHEFVVLRRRICDSKTLLNIASLKIFQQKCEHSKFITRIQAFELLWYDNVTNWLTRIIFPPNNLDLLWIVVLAWRCCSFYAGMKVVVYFLCVIDFTTLSHENKYVIRKHDWLVSQWHENATNLAEVLK